MIQYSPLWAPCCESDRHCTAQGHWEYVCESWVSILIALRHCSVFQGIPLKWDGVTNNDLFPRNDMILWPIIFNNRQSHRDKTSPTYRRHLLSWLFFLLGPPKLWSPWGPQGWFKILDSKQDNYHGLSLGLPPSLFLWALCDLGGSVLFTKFDTISEKYLF